VTSGWTVLSLMGPRSRALLQKVSRADFSNERFPFATIREVGVGHATVLASRRGQGGWVNAIVCVGGIRGGGGSCQGATDQAGGGLALLANPR